MVLSPEDRKLVREMWRANQQARGELAKVNTQLLDLMDRRDELLVEIERTAVTSLAEKFGVSSSVISYATRLRGPREGSNRRRWRDDA